MKTLGKFEVSLYYTTWAGASEDVDGVMIAWTAMEIMNEQLTSCLSWSGILAWVFSRWLLACTWEYLCVVWKMTSWYEIIVWHPGQSDVQIENLNRNNLSIICHQAKRWSIVTWQFTYMLFPGAIWVSNLWEKSNIPIEHKIKCISESIVWVADHAFPDCQSEVVNNNKMNSYDGEFVLCYQCKKEIKKVNRAARCMGCDTVLC